MMAILLFSTLSLIASTLVILAAVLSSRISRHEDWTEHYGGVEASNGRSQLLRPQMLNR